MDGPAEGEMSISSAGYSAKNILDLLEERLLGAVAVGVHDFGRHRLRQFLEEAALFLRQFLRDGDARNHVQVAMSAAGDVRHALAAQLEPRTGRSARRHLDHVLAIHERYAHVAAEREGRKRNRHLAVKVVPLAVEERVLLHVDDDVEVAGRAASRTVLSLAVETKALPGRDSRRDLRGEFALAAHAPGATARLTGTRDDLARAAARRTGTRDGEEPLLKTKLAGSSTMAAGFRAAARRCARSLARLARFLARDLNRGFGAGVGLFERDLEVVAKVGAALRTAAPPASAEHIAEAEQISEAAEDVFEAGERAGIESARPDAADPGVAVAIVGGTLVRVAQHRVRFGRLLETLLGLGIARVLVRVVLDGELPIRALQLRLGGIAADTEDFVIIPLAHPFATFTIAGRSRRSPSMYPRRNSSTTSPSRRSLAGSCATAMW